MIDARVPSAGNLAPRRAPLRDRILHVRNWLPRLRTAAATAVLALAASAALAGQVLQLRSGELVPGSVKSLDDTGVTFVRESGGEMRVSWDLVFPASRFDLWESTLAADDAAGRVKLGTWALDAELWGPARRELLRAKGLGYTGAEDLDARLADLRRREADDAISDADTLADKGELEKALDRVRSYLRGAEPGAEADRARARVPDYLARIEKRDEDQRAADEASAKAEKSGRLKEWIEKTMKQADDAKSAAGKHASDGFTHLAGGNQTRARDALAKSESGYKDARTTYGRVKKAAKDAAVEAECVERMKDCDARVVEVLTRWGRLEVENKAWKKASAVVDRGLVVDPVNRELLDLRKTIDTNWLRRKLSDVTNATGRTSSH